MNWVIYVTKSARKQLKRLPDKDFKRIEFAVEAMRFDPFVGDLEKLGGEENRWRRRVGNYRIFFQIISQEKTVYVYDIKRRTSSTY